jgi:adenylate kinase
MKKRLGFDVIILGDPASGKDTQAKLLERKFLLKSVESGKYLRGLQKNKTQLGAEIRKILIKGSPAPINVIKEFLAANVRLATPGKNLIFVGNPRLKPEAEFLVKLLSQNNRDFFVVYITLPVSKIWERSAARKRDDSDLHRVRERIAWHKRQVSKTIKFFESIHKLKIIDGNQTIQLVNKDIIRAINDYKRLKTTSLPLRGISPKRRE